MKKFSILAYLLVIIFIRATCTGPSIWVGCRNQTHYHASLYLRGTTDGEEEVIAAPGGYYETALMDNADIYNWHLRLFTNTGEEIYSDSGQVDIKYGNNDCEIELINSDEYSITWTWED